MNKKILNKNVDHVVDEMLQGFVSAYRRYYTKVGNSNIIKYRASRQDKVALVIGGGSGHEPLFAGFVGAGLADAAACGNICASPNPELVYQAGKAVNSGKGIVFAYGCYAGDNLNFDIGEEMLNAEGIRTGHIRVRDDCVSAPAERYNDRRGIAGDVFVFKILGAACDAGLSFDEVMRVGKKVRDNTYSIGIATSPCTLPGNDKPAFTLADDEIEFGMGLHGEAGVERTKMMSAEEITERMYRTLRSEAKLKESDEVIILVNGLGSTPLLELNIVYYDLEKLVSADGIRIYDAEIKNWCTSQEMGGFSITMTVLDEELKMLYNMPCYSPFYAKGSFCVKHIEEQEEYVPSDSNESDEEEVPAYELTRSCEGTLTRLNAQDAKNMLLYVAQRLISAKPYLTEVDSAIGDGDHGLGMAVGMRQVQKKLALSEAGENVYALFEQAGKAMLSSMGGASGVIFGSLFYAGAEGQAPAADISGADILAMELRSLAAIQERGKAQPGDKTMVDALYAATEAMKHADGTNLLDTLKAAEIGAEQGMLATKNYVAKFGRAKSLMERAIGYQDAGATSVYLIFKAMREFVEGTLITE